MWLLASTQKTYTSRETQTVIRVYPFFLDNELMAHISSERKCQTEVAVKPDVESKKFYSMLEYTPFLDIQNASERIINLPRKPKLHFDSGNLGRLNLGNCLLLDDDALSELCLDLRQKVRNGDYKKSSTYQEDWTQTELRVAPHILENDKVANVWSEESQQTDTE